MRHRSTLRDSLGVKYFMVSHRRPSFLGTHIVIALFKKCFKDHLVSGVHRSGKCACNVNTNVISCPRAKVLAIDARTTGRCISSVVARICQRVSGLYGSLIPRRRLRVIGGCVLNSLYQSCRKPFSLSST